MSRPCHDLALGGGGSVAVIFLYQFLRLLQEQGVGTLRSILVVDPSTRSGSGRPYQPGDKTSLLNTRTGTTSALATDPTHFWRWLQANEGVLRSDYPDLDCSPEGFVPRSVFGRYLEALYLEALELAHKLDVRLERCHATLGQVHAPADGAPILLVTDRGEQRARRLVLCTGNPPSQNFSSLLATPGYIHDPYPTDRALAHIPRDARVCVVGSGLTGTDVMLSLAKVHGVSRIVALSRNGRLQSVKSRSLHQPVLRHLTPAAIERFRAEHGRKMTLRELWDFYVREVEAFSGQAFEVEQVLVPGLDPQAYLAHELKTAESGAKPWQAVLYAINNVIEYVWRGLDDAGRAEFLHRYRDAFMSYKVAIPPVNAAALQDLLRDGRLHVLKSVGELQYNAPGRSYRALGEEAHSGLQHAVEADFVINATGFSVDYARSADPLIRQLLESGLAVASRFGGFLLDFDSACLVRADGTLARNVHCLGTAASGTYFWTSAVDVNARLALRLASAVAADVGAAEAAQGAA